MPLSPVVRKCFGSITLTEIKRILGGTKVTIVLFEDMLHVLGRNGELLLVEPCVVRGRLVLRYSLREHVPDVKDLPARKEPRYATPCKTPQPASRGERVA